MSIYFMTNISTTSNIKKSLLDTDKISVRIVDRPAVKHIRGAHSESSNLLPFKAGSVIVIRFVKCSVVIHAQMLFSFNVC